MKAVNSLKYVLQTMRIQCDGVEYTFGTVQKGADLEVDEVQGVFLENEGLSVIATQKYFDAKKLKHDEVYAKLSIDIHTSLEMVGLTAALAKALAEANIPANVVAANYHDHIFVPYEMRERAIGILEGLKQVK